MNPHLLVLGLVAAGGYLLLKSSSSSTVSPGTGNPAQAILTTPAGGAYTDASQIPAPNPAAYGYDANGNPIAANGATPGAPAATSTSGAPLVHTGYSCARTGAPIVVDGGGNPYLMV